MSKPPGQTQANVHSSILHHIFGMAGCGGGGGAVPQPGGLGSSISDPLPDGRGTNKGCLWWV